MRTKSFFRTLAIVMMLCAACSKAEKVDPTDPNANVPDPDGTVTLSMRNANSGKTYLDNSNVYIDKADNFVGGEFVSLGAVKGLGNVSYIPKAGWISQTAVVPGEGYVAYSSGKFYRIYVSRYTTNVANEIIGAEIKYQAPFGGIDEAVAVSEKNQTFESGGGTEELLFTNKSIIPCKVEAEGCSATLIYADGHSFLPQGVRITAPANESTGERKGKVTITATNGKTTEVAVLTKGSAPYIELGEAVSIDCAETTKSIRIQTNIPESELTFSSSADSWCKVGYAGERMLSLAISENTTANDRTATITVSSKDGKTKGELKVTQAKLDFDLPQTAVNFDRNVSNVSIAVTPASFSYAAKSSNESWCTFSWNKNTLTIRATANTTNANRSAKITVTVGSVSKVIQVNQSRYAIGDYYNENKIEGVVFVIEGLHGKIISLDESTGLLWSTEYIVTGATDLNDGMVNMNIIKKIPNWKALYPAFAWCETKNTNGVTGWYLPACNEVKKISLEERTAINATLQAKGKTALSEGYYWSSSEYFSSHAWGAYFGSSSMSIYSKFAACRVRAVAAF